MKAEVFWKLIQKLKGAFPWRSWCKMCRDAFTSWHEIICFATHNPF